MTRREDMIHYLKTSDATIKELALKFETTSSNIVNDLEHIFKSLKHSEAQLFTRPAQCMNSNCNFIFSSRKRLSDPSKCPKCHSERIEPQLFKVSI
jgi:predicted Zn-ribbon and HTH transcriptional regulator